MGDSYTVTLEDGPREQSSTDPDDVITSLKFDKHELFWDGESKEHFGVFSNGQQETKFDSPNGMEKSGKFHCSSSNGAVVEDGEPEAAEKGNFCDYFEIFKFATWLDIVLFMLGLVAAIVHGCCFPAMVYFMSDLMEEMLVPYQAKDVAESITNSPTDKSNSALLKDQQDQMMVQFEDAVNDICGKIAIVGLVSFIASYFQISLVTIAGENILHRVRKRSFRAILRQDIGWFDQQQTGKLVTRLTEDLEKIRQGVSDKISICFEYAASFVVAYILAFTYGPKLAAVMCSILPLMVFCGVGYSKYTVTAASEEQEKHGEAGTIAQRTFSAIRTVVSFGAEYKEMKEYNSKLKEAKKLEFMQTFLAGSFFGGIYGALFLTYSIAFWYGPKEVINGNMTTMEVFTVLFTVVVGSMSMAQAGPVVGLVTSGAASYQFLKSIINRVPPIDSESTCGITLENLQGHINFSNVSFSYPTRPSIKVLKNFTFHIEPNQTVALVGSSGSGKSTIVNILQRFYPLTQGAVTIDGVDISTINVKWLRDQIGIVSQEPILFGCSIRENIEYGRENVTNAEIERAIDEANAREFIEKLPDGLETLVGDRGSQLSGGQKQRVAIARALVRNPKILLLDEATSALDSNSERIVQEALDNARHGRTTVVVAHRLSTIRDSDQIIVMKDGEMVEAGTHDQLLGLNKVYADMIFHQSLSEKQDDEFEQYENGHVIELRTSQEVREEEKGKTEQEQTKEELPGFGAILRLNYPEMGFILIACLASLIASSVMPVFSIFIAEILEVFALPYDEMEEEALFWALMMAGMGLICFVSSMIESWALGVSGSRLTQRLRSLSFKSMIRQDMSYHDDVANHSGILTARLARETSLVQGATGVKLKSSLDALGTMTVGMGIAFYFGWQLALLLILASPLMVVAGAVQLKFATGFQLKEENDSQGAGKVTSEAISNIRTVQGLGLEVRMFNKFYNSLVAAHRSNFKAAHIFGIAQSFATSLSFFLFAAAFWFSVWLIKNDWMGSTDSFRVTFALVMAGMFVGQATGRVPDFAKAQLATKSILDLISLTPRIDNLDESGLENWTSAEEKTKSGTVHIEFKDVHFRYPSRPDVKVMSGFNLKIMKGKTVAFVGPSGCGKSTVMQLIQRFYDPDHGSVELEGNDLQTLNIRELRRQMAIVSQEPTLFDASISDNIRYGALNDSGDYDQSVTKDDIMKAAKDANLVEFVPKLPDGYDTNVGEKGTQISGGQKQRIAIARALIRNPTILILDEATSALDSESEKIVQQALDVAKVGRTCLMIAHRLTTVQNADEIVVLEHGGHIVQRGTHDQLLSDPTGLYFKLCRTQSLST